MGERLAVVVPVWGPARRELALRCVRALPTWAAPVVVWSDGDDADAFVAAGPSHARLVEAPNAPLSGKYVAGIAAARDLGADCVALWGSDDFATEESWALLADAAMLNGHSGSAVLYVHEQASGRTRRWDAADERGYGTGFPCGPGRTLRADVLAQLGWNPWNRFGEGVHRGIDGPAHEAARRAGFACALVRAPVLDVKVAGGWWCTPFEATAGLPDVTLPAELRVLMERG